MSYLDWQQGDLAGSAATARQYGAAITEWKAYANGLEAKLRNASQNANELAEQVAHKEAMLAARDAQQKALREALEQVSPNHPLLKKIRDIGGAAQAKSYKTNGYHYDLETEILRKVKV